MMLHFENVKLGGRLLGTGRSLELFSYTKFEFEPDVPHDCWDVEISF